MRTLIAAILICCSIQNVEAQVLTHHNSNSRSGTYLAEAELTPDVLRGKDFGRLYTYPVEGFIYAQPLYVNIRGSVPAVIVVTTENYVYAFEDRKTKSQHDNGPLWKLALPERAGKPAQFNRCPLTTWSIGITSTPVIDDVHQLLYVVARDNSAGTHKLHEIDLRTGKINKTTTITYRAAEHGDGFPPIDFEPAVHLNRAALLLNQGKVYIAFGAMCDLGDAHGWLFSYETERLRQVGAFVSTPHGNHCIMPGKCYVEGGIWQSGSGLVADDDNNVYFITGNGLADPDHRDFGDSFVRLRTGGSTNDLSFVSSFTPANEEDLSEGDVDLGSGGPVLLPDNTIVGGGKQGVLYVLSHDDLSPRQKEFQAFFNTWHPQQPYSKIPPCPEQEDNLVQVLTARHYALKKDSRIPVDQYGKCQYYAPNIHGGPIFWQRDGSASTYIYGTAEKDFVRVFEYHDGNLSPTAMVSEIRAPDGMPGGLMSLSANGGKSGIIWISLPEKDNTFFVQGGRFFALDAVTLKTLWQDEDRKWRFAKFVPPTISNGKVFRATNGKRRWGDSFLFKTRHQRAEVVVYGKCSSFGGCE